MDKLQNLKKELVELEKQERKAKELIQASKHLITDRINELKLYYDEFFSTKRSKEFVLYEEYPGFAFFEPYIYHSSTNPLSMYCSFNAKELAETIKQLYQFQRQKEYHIITFGTTRKYQESYHQYPFEYLEPGLYLVIGNSETLKNYQDLNGFYSNNDLWYIFDSLKSNIITFNVDTLLDYHKQQPFDIETLSGDANDMKERVNYYYLNSHRVAHFAKDKEMIPHHKYLPYQELYQYDGIQDIFDFNIHKDDAFIASVLLSICIYKRNNGITELSSDDYNHIFETLYNEKVDIKGQTEQDIPKHLTYVPNIKLNK